jgi:hypothetical protein
MVTLSTLSLLGFGIANAAPFQNTPGFVSELDSDAIDASKDKVYASGDLAELKGTVLISDESTTYEVGVSELLDAETQIVRAAFSDAHAAGAFSAKPIMTDSFVELEDRYILQLVTEADVTDPYVAAKHIPEFASTHAPGATYDDLSKTIQGHIKDIASAPSAYYADRDDLATALAKGDPELLAEAMFDGLGLLRVTSNLVIYKPGRGPIDSKVSNLLLNASEEVDAMPEIDPAIVKMYLEDTKETTAGDSIAQQDIVALGWVYSFCPENQHRWEMGVGFIRVSYGVVLRAGVRMPYKVRHTMDPINIEGPGDVAVNYTHSIEPIDATANDYARAGLEQWSGDEASLVARAWVGGKVYLFGSSWVHIRRPNSDDPSVGGDMTWDLVNSGTDYIAPLDDQEISYRMVFNHQETGLSAEIGFMSAGIDLGMYFGVVGDWVQYDIHTINMSDADGGTRFRSRHDTEHQIADTFLQHGGDTGEYGVELSDVQGRYSLILRPGIRASVNIELTAISGMFRDWYWASPWWEPLTYFVVSATLDGINDPVLDVVVGERID